MTNLSVQLPVPDYVGDYQVQKPLGYGNSGRVYLARPPLRLGLTEELVAVKVFNGPCPDAAYDLAVEELRTVSSLPSPFLARVYEAGLTGSSLFYASEYVALGSLAAAGRPLSQIEVLLAVSHAAQAAHTMHEAGIAHTAIKPQNVLIGPHSALLSDLGLGRFLRPGLTTGVATSGSVEYLDPAVLRGGSPSRSSEVWALGATLHRALSGVGLYGDLSHTDPLRVIRTVMSASPALAPHLGPDAAALIQACLLPIARRIPTAAVFGQQLVELAKHGQARLSGE
ncbi:MAG: protein kinase [Actinomycetota bacterium]|nr:protein kinase [Actinomycetota bacterium]